MHVKCPSALPMCWHGVLCLSIQATTRQSGLLLGCGLMEPCNSAEQQANSCTQGTSSQVTVDGGESSTRASCRRTRALAHGSRPANSVRQRQCGGDAVLAREPHQHRRRKAVAAAHRVGHAHLHARGTIAFLQCLQSCSAALTQPKLHTGTSSVGRLRSQEFHCRYAVGRPCLCCIGKHRMVGPCIQVYIMSLGA